MYGADLNQQTEGSATTSVFGTLFTGVDLDTRHILSAEAARAVCADAVGIPNTISCHDIGGVPMTCCEPSGTGRDRCRRPRARHG